MPGMTAAPPAEPATRPSVVPAGAAPMTLAEFEAIAMRSNPTLVQAQAQVEASLAKSFQAGLFPNPIFGYASEQIGAQGRAGETQGAFFEQEIVRGGKLRLSRAKYRQEADQAQLQVMAQEVRILNGVRIRFYEVLAAQRMVDVERRLLANAEEMVRTVREMVNVGQANRPDLLQAQIYTQRRRVDVQAAENRYRQSWEFLITLIAAPHLAPAPLADDLEQDGPPIDWDASLQYILQQSPEVLVARAEVLRDRITVQRERVQPIPNAFVRGITGYNFEVNNPTAGLQIGFNFPVWNRNQGTIREAMAEVTRASAEVARIELALRRRLAEVFARYKTAQATVQIYRGETLPMAREAYELLLMSYRDRRVPWAEVVMAGRTLSDVNEEYVEALLTMRHAEVEIRGMLLVDGLSEPAPPTPGGHIDATPQPR
jgi:cobalt-zinc-cadmium efflux system outer membrane protein